MLIKIIKTYRDVIAVCDANLLGKKFEEGKFQLDVKESFFKGEKTYEEEAVSIMKQMSVEDSTFNIIGEKSVNAAVKEGILSKQEVNEIQGIPFALILISIFL